MKLLIMQLSSLSLVPWRGGLRLVVRVPREAHENILQQSKRNTGISWTLNLEPALILALTKIRPRTEVLACQKQAQSSH
jgi:hypothetical protein